MSSFIQEKINDGKLILWLPLTDGSFQDRSTNEHTVVPTGTNPCLDREGLKLKNQSYLDVNDANDLSFGDGVTDSPFTFAMWVKLYGTVDVNPFLLKGQKNSWTNYEYRFGTISSGKLILYLVDQVNGGTIGRFVNTSLTGYENQWIHITGTYDGSATVAGIKIYLNGVRVDDSNAIPGTYVAMSNSVYTLQVGKIHAAYFDGSAKHITIFNEALTETEIMELLNETANTKYPTKSKATSKSLDLKELEDTGIHASYDMNTAGNTVIDSANGFDGTIINASKTNTSFGRGMVFDGVDTTISLPNLGYTTGDSYTQSYWVKMFDLTTKQVFGIFGYNYASSQGWLVGNFITSPGITWYRRGVPGISTSFEPVANVWYNVTVTCNGSTGLLSYYINGELIGTNDTTGLVYSTYYTIGADSTSYAVTNGVIGPTQYWTRELSQTEVENLYKKGKFINYKTDWGIYESSATQTVNVENSDWAVEAGGGVISLDSINGEVVKVASATSSTWQLLYDKQSFTSTTSTLYGTYEFWMKHSAATSWGFYVSSNPETYPDYIGYKIGYWSGNGKIYIQKSDGVTPSDIIQASLSPDANTWYKVKVTRGVNGEFSLYVNDVLVTATYGSNPVTDNTYTEGNFMRMNLETGVKMSWSDKRGNYSFKRYEGVV